MSADVIPTASQNLDEIRAILDHVEPTQLRELVGAIENSPTIFFQGSGRTLLMLKAVAMRLMHMGLSVHVVGDVLTPAITEGDLLIAVSARGGTGTHAAIATATRVGARVAAITTRRENLSEDIELVLTLPARTEVPSAQHAGSLFEQSLLILGDAICRTIQHDRAIAAESLNARHANL